MTKTKVKNYINFRGKKTPRYSHNLENITFIHVYSVAITFYSSALENVQHMNTLSGGDGTLGTLQNRRCILYLALLPHKLQVKFSSR